MDGPKILEVIDIYRKHFTEKGIKVFVFPKKEMPVNRNEIAKVIGRYRAYFEERGVGILDFPHENIPGLKEEVLAHCHGMLGKMESFVKEGRIEKTFRWLGFILGCLWSVEHDRHPKEEIPAYCHGVLDKIDSFVSEGCLDKAFVWLGFVQGCLWSTRQYSLEELKNHNRPVEETH